MGTWQEIIQQHQRRKAQRVERLKKAIASSEVSPTPHTEGEVNRTLNKEEHANFKVVCECNAVRYFKDMNISELNEAIQYDFHPTHMKAVFYRDGMRHQFRGRVPAMIPDDERDEFGMKKGE